MTIGVINPMEFLGVVPDQPVEAYIKGADYVPVSKQTQSLLTDMRGDGNVLSIVVDEYGDPGFPIVIGSDSIRSAFG